jgi:hypothetical protein
MKQETVLCFQFQVLDRVMIHTFGFENKIAGICNSLVQTYGYFLAEVIVPRHWSMSAEA